jgi:hypothetical protein
VGQKHRIKTKLRDSGSITVKPKSSISILWPFKKERMSKEKYLLLLYCLTTISCLRTDDEDFRKHMLIHEGLYKIENDSTKTFKFNKDGTGEEVDFYPSLLDTTIEEFTWNTSDWYEKSTVIEYHIHKRRSFNKWEDLNLEEVQPVRNISDTIFEACRVGLGLDYCLHGSSDYWKNYLKISSP